MGDEFEEALAGQFSVQERMLGPEMHQLNMEGMRASIENNNKIAEAHTLRDLNESRVLFAKSTLFNILALLLFMWGGTAWIAALVWWFTR
jgi:uncharacterized membrane protein